MKASSCSLSFTISQSSIRVGLIFKVAPSQFLLNFTDRVLLVRRRKRIFAKKKQENIVATKTTSTTKKRRAF